MLIAPGVGKETVFIMAFNSFWAPAWKPFQNHKAVRTDNWLVPGPLFHHCMFTTSAPDSYLPFASSLLDQTNTILSTCPYTSGFLTAYQPSSLFWAVLSPCLELNTVFQLKHCQRGMETMVTSAPCTHTSEHGRHSPHSVFLLVSCSFVTVRYHSTCEWHKDNSVGNIFCSYSQGQKSHTFGFFFIFQMYSLVTSLSFFSPGNILMSWKKALSPFWSTKENKYNVGNYSVA